MKTWSHLEFGHPGQVRGNKCGTAKRRI